jgi:hypothetical protein
VHRNEVYPKRDGVMLCTLSATTVDAAVAQHSFACDACDAAIRINVKLKRDTLTYNTASNKDIKFVSFSPRSSTSGAKAAISSKPNHVSPGNSSRE